MQESIAKRLSELKKVSIELKSKILQDSRIDPTIVSEILTGVLPFSNMQVSLPVSQTHTFLDIPLKNDPRSASNNSLNYSPNSSVFVATATITSSATALSALSPARNQELILWNQNTSSHESSPSREAIEFQIQKIRSQNDQIQNRISIASSEIAQLRAFQSIRQQESWKQYLPFINRQGTLQAFFTKLHVKDYDFDKIDYEKSQTELMFDKLTIQLSHRTPRILKLGTLNEVKYLGNRRMRLEFKQDQITYLYLQFGSETDRQEWDLAFITNNRIITDKDLNPFMFAEQKEKQKEKEKEHIIITKVRSKLSLKITDGEGDGRNSDKEQRRKGSVLFNERKYEKPSNQLHSSSLRRSELSAERSQLDYTLNGASFAQTPEGLINNSSAVSESNKEKSLKDFMVFGEVGESHNASSANKSKLNAPEVNFQNFQTYPTFTQEPLSFIEETPKKEGISKSTRALNQLKDGYFFTKYAKNGFKPHNKKVFISSDEDMLICANSEDLKERRAVKIENITALKYPALGEGIQKYVKNGKSENFCVIQYQNQGKYQVMELGCNKMTFIKRFSQQLTDFLRKKGIIIKD